MDSVNPENLSPAKRLERLLNPIPGVPVDQVPLTPEEEAEYVEALENSDPKPPSKMPSHLIAIDEVEFTAG